jgi:hypothetical protein
LVLKEITVVFKAAIFSTRQYRKRIRMFLTWVTLLAVLGLLGYKIAYLETMPEKHLNDFVAFWSAGRLTLANQNPYDPEQLFPLQKEAGRKKPESERSWNPPWTLVFIMPFSLLQYSIAAKLWLLTQLGIVFFCADWLWRIYSGPTPYRWVAWIVGLFFFPTLYLLQLGQISAMVLLGITGFLHHIKQGKGLIAGFFLLFVAIKPHLLYLFWIALVLWGIKERGWAVLLGMVLVLVAASAVSVGVNHEILGQYLEASKNAPEYLSTWATPTFGTVFRILFGMDRTWLQMVPPLLGMLWFFFYWIKHSKTWEWGKEIPVLLLGSIVTSFYSWGYDQVVLLVPVMQGFIKSFCGFTGRSSFWSIAAYIGINLIAFAFALDLIFSGGNAFWFIWLAPSILIWYWTVEKALKPKIASVI